MRFNDHDDELDDGVHFPIPRDETNRLCALYGDLNEKKGASVIGSMLALRHSGERQNYILSDEQKAAVKEATDKGDKNFDIPEEELKIETVFDPFEFFVSTRGGEAKEMLAIYDVMRGIRDEMEIHTVGMGKVMSAGVPLLAAGTKGKRKIGKYCRVMIHNVQAGAIGDIDDVKKELEEIELMQDQYIKILAEETTMTEAGIRSLLTTKTNVYLSAEEALSYGIADIIV